MRTIIGVALASITLGAAAHSGGTDRNGCHHDHKNGGYHCHAAAPINLDASAKRAQAVSVQPVAVKPLKALKAK